MSNYPPATLLKADGSKTVIIPTNNNKFTLKKIQEYVEGYIEVISLDNNLIMVINENGKLLELPKNKKATELANFHPDFEDYITGDVVICSTDQVN